MNRDRYLRGTLLVACAAACETGVAEVVFDGTLGPMGSLAGDMEIVESFGTRAGENLFHSFETFNINAGESATFTSTFEGLTENVIGRVTGGSLSTIEGLIASQIPGADIWLVNPSGIVFGAAASIDIKGSFHASTADYLVFEDGARFEVVGAGNAVLSMANPSAFGFLDAGIGSITVNSAELAVPAREGLTLVGGDIGIRNASLTASRGFLELQSAAGPGEFALARSIAAASTVTEFGVVSLRGSELSTSGGSSGEVFIRGGELVMGGASMISSVATGTGSNAVAGDIRIEVGDAVLAGGSQIHAGTAGSAAGGTLSLTATGLVLIEGAAEGDGTGGGGTGGGGTGGGGTGGGGTGGGGTGGGTGGGGGGTGGGGTGGGGTGGGGTGGGGGGTGGGGSNAFASGIFSDVEQGATGDGGNVQVSARVIEIRDQAQASSATRGSGRAGTVELTATQRLTVTQEAQVNARSFGPGSGGNVVLHAPVVELINGVRIGSEARGEGQGGNIVIIAPEALVMTGTNGKPDPADNRGSRISASSAFTANGDAGSIRIEAGRIELGDGARIAAQTSGVGDGGTIEIVTTGPVTLAGARADGRPTSIRVGASIEEEETGVIDAPRLGDAGMISIAAPSLVLSDGAEIASDTSLPGRGGNIALTADTIVVQSRARVSATATVEGNAGNVLLSATDTLYMNGGSIETSAVQSAGGNIMINVGDTIRLVDSLISAEARGVTAGADGGNVNIDPDFVILDSSSIVASANAGNGGNIEIVAGAFVIDAYSLINASSNTGLDGEIDIDSPNEISGGVIQLDSPTLDTADLLAQRCVPRRVAEQSSLVADTGRQTRLIPNGYLSSSPAEQAVRGEDLSDVRSAPGVSQLIAALGEPSCFGIGRD